MLAHSLWSWTRAPFVRRHLGFPLSQAPLGQNLGRCRGRGEVRRWGPAGEVRNCQEKAVNCVNRGVKASFTLDLPDLKFFFISFFRIPCIEKHAHNTGMLLHMHPKPRRFRWDFRFWGTVTFEILRYSQSTFSILGTLTVRYRMFLWKLGKIRLDHFW